MASVDKARKEAQSPRAPNADVSSGGSASGSDTGFLSASAFKMLLLVLMVLQNSSAVLVGRHTRTVPKEELYSVNHLVFMVEVFKLFLSAALEFYATKGMIMASLKVHVLDRPMDALKITVPALLYLLQNTLLYVALSNLSAPLFQVTYQCKLVTTAVVSVIMLKRQYKFQQWICLFILSVAVAIVVLGESSKQSKVENATQNLFVGLTSVSVSCFCSAFAGVYFELVVKKKSPSHDAVTGKEIPQPSLWMRNMQLAFYSLTIAYLQGMYEESKAMKDDNGEMAGKPYLFGFTFWVWVLVLVQAFGGLLVAAVIKYADNVLKGLATGVSVVFATSISIMFFGTQLSIQFAFGATMILGSVYVFSNPVDVRAIMGNRSRDALPI